ncbi:hypothetical protein [Streptomyces sp. SID3343]|uniref:hypothetical protein n=1 Tax=Streptomyces sp. SID3343 TaxID=2690260 RepID=UPI001369F8FA|nr:hypothetical protein [Streptomyces sp. SID3343]MYW01228.1 hypothetical protein [Streptomyces sp. SID3343]
MNTSLGARIALARTPSEITPPVPAGPARPAWSNAPCVTAGPPGSSPRTSRHPIPTYFQLFQDSPRTAGERVRVDYHAWREQAEAAHVRVGRGDMVVEISPGSATAFAHEITLAGRAGYRIELVALHTSRPSAGNDPQAHRGGGAAPGWTTSADPCECALCWRWLVVSRPRVVVGVFVPVGV